MSKGRNIFLEVAFWIGGLFGALFGLMFAQRKGKDFRGELMKNWEKGGVKGASEVALEEMRESGMEAWIVTKDEVKGTEAWKQASQKADEIWENLDPETKQMIQAKLEMGKKMAGQAKSRVKQEGKVWLGRAKEEGKKLADQVKAGAKKKMAEVKKDAKKQAGKAVKRAKKEVKKQVKKVTKK